MKSVEKINEDGCIEFLRKYGKGQLSESLKIFSLGEGDDIQEKYEKWIKWKNDTKPNFGGTPQHLVSTMFGIDEVVYNYEWGTLGMYNWIELFQYVHGLVNGKNY